MGDLSICWGCHHSYVEYGELLCKYEGCDDVPDESLVLRCPKYSPFTDDEIAAEEQYIEYLSKLDNTI